MRAAVVKWLVDLDENLAMGVLFNMCEVGFFTREVAAL
jgi:hypothetical protein